ncbi:hypothetical protein Ndes2437A_g02875 [Nannochloris sp. 'desiccata']
MDIDISKEEEAKLVKEIKSRKRASSKTSIVKASPLKHAPQQQRRSSRTAFVKRWDPRQGHKLKTLQKAQELLQQGGSRTEEGQQELDRLLSQLTL